MTTKTIKANEQIDSILVKGNGALNGVIPIAGAKNACLTLMPATLLSEEPLTLTNAPRLSDIRTMTQLLQSLGVEVSPLQAGKVITMSSHAQINPLADYEIVRKMRASNWCWVRCWRGWVMRLSRCRAVAPSARARWIFISTR